MSRKLQVDSFFSRSMKRRLGKYHPQTKAQFHHQLPTSLPSKRCSKVEKQVSSKVKFFFLFLFLFFLQNVTYWERNTMPDNKKGNKTNWIQDGNIYLLYSQVLRLKWRCYSFDFLYIICMYAYIIDMCT